MLERIRKFFINKKISQMQAVNKDLGRKINNLNEKLVRLNYEKCEAQYLVHNFQEKIENITNTTKENGIVLETKKLMEFLSYSYNFTKDESGNGKLAIAMDAVKTTEFQEGEPPSFWWRGMCAKVKDGKIIFYPGQLDTIEWKCYPTDAHLFIEWISHHIKILDEGKDSKLKTYIIELN